MLYLVCFGFQMDRELTSFLVYNAGYGSNLGVNSGYGSGTYGSALGGYGSSSYGGGMYGGGSSMYNRGGYGGGGLYGSSGMYGGGGGMYNSGLGGGYGMGMGTGTGMGMGMGMGMSPYGGQDPNDPYNQPPSPPGFWISFLRVVYFHPFMLCFLGLRNQRS